MSMKGCYGKIPAHGDFVWQGLPAEFVTPWDAWLQSQMATMQTQLGEHWLEAYLQSPLWRFMIRDEALGPHVWCGVTMPSVDAVGRYFPFTMAEAVPWDSQPLALIEPLQDWFGALEVLILGALTQGMKVDALTEAFDGLRIPATSVGAAQCRVEAVGLTGSFAEGDTAGLMESLASTLLTQRSASSALWLAHDPEGQRTHFTLTEGFGRFYLLR